MTISVIKFQDGIGDLLKSLSFPHLPGKLSDWLANNSWWMAVLGVLSAMYGALYALASLAKMFLFAINISTEGFNFGYTPISFEFGILIQYIVNLLFMVATVYLLARAVTPLNKLQKRGWDLLFSVYLISVLYSFVNLLINLDAFVFILYVAGIIIASLISAHLLFEVKSHFQSV